MAARISITALPMHPFAVAGQIRVLQWFGSKLCCEGLSRCPVFALLLVSLLVLSRAVRTSAQVQAAPVPDEMRNSFFAITVNNQRVDVAHAASNYEFVSFDTKRARRNFHYRSRPALLG